jgi:hypothetical protein
MQLGPASLLPGAKGRLLPASIPFSFFGAAIIFHVLLWAVLLRAAGELASFGGGLGHSLGALHILTLGVLASTAMGAAFQLLQVATRQPLVALWPARAAFWLFAPGVLLLVHGMGEGSLIALDVGGGSVAAGLVMYGWLVADNLRRSPEFGNVGLHAWVSMAALLLLIVAGLVLVLDFSTGVVRDRGALALAHAILGLYGFMGTLALGFSYVLVPMFALASAVPMRLGMVSLGLWAFALVMGVAGALLSEVHVIAAAATIACAAGLIHIGGISRVLAKRMRKHLGLSFTLIRAAWGLLVVSLVLGACAALGWLGARGPALFGFVAAFGWLLTFHIGILQRILPFLAAMHSAKGSRPPLVSQLVSARALAIHAVCHFVALGAVIVGIALDKTRLIAGGAVIGLVGSVAFAWFGAVVFFHVIRAAASRAAASTAVLER